MSTGEVMILNLIASLYANIRQNSLIVFDEMEVHLHPKAIRQMMSLLFKLTKEFNSACILATHSKEYTDVITQFCHYRGDCLTIDMEIVAFAITLWDFEIE